MRSSTRIRLGLPFALVFIGLLVVEGRLYQLQVLSHDRLSEKAKRESRRVIARAPERGTIRDRGGIPLVTNIRTYSLYAHPAHVGDPARAARLLAPILNLEYQGLLERFTRERTFVWIERRLAVEKRRAVDELDLDGLGWIEETSRFYPQGRLGAHVLGFVGVDNQGLSGLEYRYEEQLRGRPGRYLLEADALGREIPFTKQELEPLVPGNELILTIDSIAQSIVEEELAEALVTHEARSAEAIFLEPQTGKIIALANKPDFSPADYGAASPYDRRNRVVQDVYEPGSTFKIVTLSALLKYEIMEADDTVFCQARLQVADHVFEDWHAFNREMDLAEIICHSSDIGTIKAGLLVEPEVFHTHIMRVGFGAQTGVDLPGEAAGIVRSPSRWSMVDRACMTIGHGVAVTPLQMVCALGGLINGGRLMSPYVVQRIVTPEGKVLHEAQPQMVRRTVTETTSVVIRRIMKDVVARGTGRAARLKQYSMGGKTGTAQIPSSDGKGYLPHTYIASFMGFAPVGSPKIAGIVVIKRPTGAYYASEVAAPVFGRIMRRLLPHFNVPSDRNELATASENTMS